MEVVLESAVKREVDLVLIQEPRAAKERDRMRSHPSFTFIKGEEGIAAKCWIAVNKASRCRVTELKDLARESGNHVQVVEVTLLGGDAIVIANTYDQHEGSETNRPAQRAAWTEIARHRRVIIAGDMNTHSKVWNPRATRSRNHTFWERLIEEEDLFVWNTDEATRMGPGAENHSIIDLTLSSPNMELNWCLLGEEATESDHELIAWEVLGTPDPRADTSMETTGWDISGWDPARESEEEEKKKAEGRRAKARECYLAGVGRTPILSDESTKEQVTEAAGSLRESMTMTRDEHARKKRWCSRSKPWWCEELKELRKDLGRARRKWRVAGMSWVKAARREFRRPIRKAKRDCWNRFLQEADGNKVWTAVAYTTPRIDKAGQVLAREDGSIAEGPWEWEHAILQAHFPQGPPGSYTPAEEGGQTFRRIDAQLVRSLLRTAAKTSAPGDDRISAGIIKVFWQWDEQRIAQLGRACIRLGFHPGIWKRAKGVVIPKRGKPDYSKVRAYRVISLLDVISKLLEITAAHLIADHLERKQGLHQGQFGCWKRRSCVDAVAILMNRTQQAWEKKQVAGALFMDVKSAFNNVDKTVLGKRMEELGVEADLIRWTMSFMTDRQVRLVLDGEVGVPNAVDTGVPQGSPAAPILFVTYLSGIFDAVEQAAPGNSGLSFIDDIGWWVEGRNDKEVAAKLSQAAAAAIEWAGKNGVAFDQGKMEAAMFWRRKRGTVAAAKVKVGDSEVPFNKEATRWLGVWLKSQLTLKEHHATRLKSGRNAMTRLRMLTGKMGLSPANCRRIMMACIQSVAMFGAELWWKGGNVRGMTGRAEELQRLVNQQSWATTGAFRTTNLGALSMESGLRPAANQLENRQRRFGLRLLSLPQGDEARKVVIGSSTAIGKSLKTALNRTWTSTEQTVLLEDPEPFNAELIQEDREGAKREAQKERLGLIMFTDRSRLEDGAAGYAVAWKSGLSWKGITTHLGYNQEAFDTECTALVRVLESASR